MKKLVIIDGKSVFYRGYYAIRHLSTRAGRPTGGIYGFCLLALEIIKRLEPDYVIVAWDKSKTNINSRKKLFASYKANRKSAPDDFYDQIPDLFDLISHFGWPLFEIDDYEADDIIATLATQATQVKGLRTILVSSDLDLLQVVDAKTQMYAIKKNLRDIQQFDIAGFEAKYQIKIGQFRDFKSLMGDSSDNIPGVRGIGPKAATDLLQTYPDLETIYDNLSKLPSKYQTKLVADRQMAFLSRQLVTLKRDLPIKLDLQAALISNLDQTKLLTKLRQLEFYSLIRQLPKEIVDSSQTQMSVANRFDKAAPKVTFKRLSNLADYDWSQPVLVQAYCQGRFGQAPGWLLISDDWRRVDLIKVDRRYQLPNQTKKQLPDQLTIFGHSTKTALQLGSRLGLKIQVSHDVELAAFLLDGLMRNFSLDSLANDYFDYDAQLTDISPDDFKDCAGDIALLIRLLKQTQTAKLAKLPQLDQLYRQVELPFIAVLARLEMAGISFQPQLLDDLNQAVDAQIADFEKLIYSYSGKTFNIASPAQLAKVLYDDLKLPTAQISRSRTSWRTDINQLNRLKDKHPIINCLIGWRELAKLRSTYLQTLPKHRQADGRIRSDFQQTAVVTGRLSSSRPNLQNIPITSDVGRQVRRAFVASEGHQLINADYSQFELRLAACLSGEPNLKQAFLNGQDIHSLTASLIFEVDIDQVDRKQRKIAKNVNFGVLYGQGPRALARQTDLSFSDAQDFIDKYFDQRPLLKDYLEATKSQAINRGYVETLFGRRRPTPDAQSPQPQVRQAALRQAINFPIQGTEADLMKMAMIKLDQLLEPDCRQVLQIHDSILIDCPKSKLKPTIKLVQQTMETIYPKLGIDLKVDIKTGSNWLEV